MTVCMRNVHDVATYAVLGIVFLLAFRATTEDKQGVHVVPTTVTQSVQADPRRVTVTGTAEMLIPPDEISVSISYREYWRANGAKGKMGIDSIEKRVVKAAKKAGIAADKISIDSYGGWRYNWNYWNYWYGSSSLMMQRSLTIQLDTTSELKKIIEKLKSESIQKEGIVGITLSGTSHSKIQEHRKTVKKRALQAAQDKAAYLLESVSAARGPLVSVTELKDPQAGYDYGGYGWTRNSLGVSNVSVSVPYDPGSEGYGDLGMKPIRLQYAIEAVFEIKGAG